MNADPAIRARGLVKRFGGVEALRGFDLDVPRGAMVGLVGPDGAGKSTAIRLLCGLLEPDAGEATVLGLDLRRDRRAIKARIGYLSQRFTLYGDLSLDENLQFFADLHGVRDAAARRDVLLRRTALLPFRARLAERLSGGMKKKLALACTLIHTPDLLFLDEPSTGVDPVSRGEFWTLLSEMVREGMTVLLTTPYLDEAERCDRVGFLSGGRMLATGTPDDLRRPLEGRTWRLTVDDPLRAYTLLRETWSAAALTLDGEGLRFQTAQPDADLPEIRRHLDAAGLGPVRVEPTRASMEDVFVALAAPNAVPVPEGSAEP